MLDCILPGSVGILPSPVGEGSSRRQVSGIVRFGMRLRRWAAPLLILAALIAAWELWTQLGDVPKWQLPAPSVIAQELVESRGLLWEHTQVTLLEVLLGFVAALIVGLFLASGIAYSRILERSVYPIVIASQTIPIIER